MIALSYGITYIWGTVGIILICKYLPKWWGVDAKAAAREYEREHGVASGDVPALSGWTAGGLRAYRLENDAWVGKTLYDLLQAHPEYRVVNLARDGTALGADLATPLKRGDIVALGGKREAMTEKMGLIGPEVSDRVALDVPLDKAEILVTNSELLKKTREEWRALPGADQVQVVGLERSGVPIPIGTDTKLQRMDILTVAGVKSAVSEVGAAFGRIVRPSTATDLLTLSLGMILGFLIGADPVPGLRRQGRPRQRRRAARLRRHRLLDRLAPALLRQHPDRGPQRSGGSRPRRLRRHRRHQCRQLPACPS